MTSEIYSLDNCTCFMDIFLAVKNYGADIKAATLKVWSTKKYRDREDVKFATENYPYDWALIDALMDIK